MKKFKDDYEIISSTDEKGREKETLAYRGVYFDVVAGKSTLTHIKRQSLLMLALIVILHVSGGFLKNRSMYQLYVSLPYVFAYMAIWYTIIGTLRFPTQKRKYRRDEIDLSINRAQRASKTLMILLILGELGGLFFLAFNSGANMMAEYLYLTFNALAITTLFFIIRLQGQINVHSSTEQ